MSTAYVTAVQEGQPPQEAADQPPQAAADQPPQAAADQPPQAAADQPQAVADADADMQAAEEARALRPVSPRGTAVPRVPSGGAETYVSAIVSHSGRQLKQVVLGMSEAEVCAMFSQALSNLSRGSGSPVSATGGRQATASSPQGQPQAAVDVAANVPQEPDPEEPSAVEVAAIVPEEPANVAANVPTQGQPQAAVEVAANVLEESGAVEVAANVPEEPAVRGPGEEPAMHAMPVFHTPGPGELQGRSCQSDLAGFSPGGIDYGGIRVP